MTMAPFNVSLRATHCIKRGGSEEEEFSQHFRLRVKARRQARRKETGHLLSLSLSLSLPLHLHVIRMANFVTGIDNQILNACFAEQRLGSSGRGRNLIHCILRV